MTTKRNATASEITAFIGLGSNVGDREANLREAIARLDQRGVEVSRESSIYETEPVGYVDQRWFLNQVIECRIPGDLKAELLLAKLLDVERDMGRVRTIANGPRIVDIDLLLFGELVAGPLQNDEGEFRAKTRRTSKTQPAGLIVPHPRMHLRRFVMEPLCEIAPEVIHPVIKKPCREILSSLNDPSSVRLYEPKAIKP
jgi:2-amino-4-hydroxy-6-hydroxymethyldihydropteridine diphosphokinase